MASLDDVKKQLEEANKGTTPYAELQQDNQLKTLEVMNTLVGKIDKLSGVVAAPPPSDDDKPGGDKPKPKNTKDLTFLEKISKTMDAIKKGAEDRFRAMTFQKKKEKRSGLGKDLESGKESGNVYNLAAEKIKNPFAMLAGKIKMMGAQVVQAVGKLLGFVSSIFSPLTALIIGVGAGIYEAYKAWVGTEGSVGDKIVAAVKGFVDGFFTGIGKALEFIANLVPKLLKALGFEKEAKIVEDLIADVKEFVVGLYNSIKEALEPLGKLFESAVKWVEDNWTEIEIVIGGIWAATKAVIAAVWDTLVMSFDGLVLLFTTVKDWFVENWDSIKEGIDLLWNNLMTVVTTLFDFFKSVFVGIKDAFNTASTWISETWTKSVEVVDTVWNAVKDAVTNVFNFYKGIFQGIKTVFEGVLAFFTAEDGEEKDDKIQAVMDLFTAMKEKLFGVFESIGKLFTNFLEMIGIDVSSLLPDVGALVDGAKQFFSDIIGKAIKFIKSKLSFFGGGDDDEDTRDADMVEASTDSGLLTRTDKWYEKGKKVEVDQSKLDEMSPDAIIELGQSLSSQGLMTPEIEDQLSLTVEKKKKDRTGFEEFSDQNLHSYIRGVESRQEKGIDDTPNLMKQDMYKERARRPGMQLKEGTGTLGTALNAVPEVPLVLQSAGKPAPSTGNIVGLGQESVGQSGTMNNAQASLEETKTINYVSQSAGNNTVVNSDNSTSVVNTSVYNPAVSPAMDTSDRTTGSYRDYMSYR